MDAWASIGYSGIVKMYIVPSMTYEIYCALPIYELVLEAFAVSEVKPEMFLIIDIHSLYGKI